MMMISIQPLLDRGWLRFLLSLLVLVLLHFPLSLLRLQPAGKLQKETGIRLPAVVSLPPLSSPRLSNFERDLYAWSSIADPKRMLHPDFQHGFSRYGDPAVIYPQPSLPVWSLQPFFWPRTDFPESSLGVAGLSLRDLIRDQWNQEAEIFLLPHEKITPPGGVFWRLAGSRTPIRSLPMPEEFRLLVENPQETGKITGVTLLELARMEGFSFPRIVVRRSCGNSQFDRLAVLAIRRHLQIPLDERAGSAEAAISESGLQLLEVDWRLPQFGGKP